MKIYGFTKQLSMHYQLNKLQKYTGNFETQQQF